MSQRFSLITIAGLALGFATPALAQVAVGDVYASDASVKGTIMLAGGGTRVFSGSQVGAGAAPALLKLSRGGYVRICPGTNLSVAASANGTELMFSVNTGSLEFHYDLPSGADSIITPDFQMRLQGPASYHIGLGADERGATCVKGLQQNNAPVTVSETFGDGQYSVKPSEEVVFLNGHVSESRAGALAHCGCPEPPAPVMRTEAVTSELVASAAPAAPADSAPILAAPPSPETHVEVEAPLEFRGNSSEPDVAYRVLRLETRSSNDLRLKLEPTVVPPKELASKEPEQPPKASTQVAQKKSGGGFFKKLGGFFSKLFKG